MRKNIKKRLHSQAGETIAEVLISLLIAVVALMMLAMMISSTVSMVTTSKNKMEEYYGEESGIPILELQTGSSDPTTITIKMGKMDGIATPIETPSVNLYISSVFNNPVYAYQSADNSGG